MTGKTYDILKRIGNIVLPALATCYGAIAKIWGLPYGFEIPATITALAVLLNAILQKESTKYHSLEENNNG